MIATVESSSVLGIDALAVEIEVDVSQGLPSFHIVGLPDAACRESQDRVRSAIKNSGYKFPVRKITINMAPANVRKQGSGFDLAIAIGILVASEQIPNDRVGDCIFNGELSLDGRVKPISGVLSRVVEFSKLRKRFVFPYLNLNEAMKVKAARLKPVKTLIDAVNGIGENEDWCGGEQINSRAKPRHRHDFSDVKGQYYARRGIY